MNSLMDSVSGKNVTSIYCKGCCIFCNKLHSGSDECFRLCIDKKTYKVCDDCEKMMEIYDCRRCDVCVISAYPMKDMTRHVVPEENNLVIFVCKNKNDQHDKGRRYRSA